MTSGASASLQGLLSLDSNQAQLGGALALIAANLLDLTGRMSLTNNFAAQGGALYSQAQACLVLNPGSSLSVENNTATAGGGGGAASFDTQWTLQGDSVFAGESGKDRARRPMEISIEGESAYGNSVEHAQRRTGASRIRGKSRGRIRLSR